LKKYDVIHKKRVKIPKYTPTQLERTPRFCQFLLRKHFCDQKVARSGIAPLCKENVGMVGTEKNQNSAQMCLRHDPLKMFVLCWLMRFMPKNEAELCGQKLAESVVHTQNS
jgi:hypothetical protein